MQLKKGCDHLRILPKVKGKDSILDLEHQKHLIRQMHQTSRQKSESRHFDKRSFLRRDISELIERASVRGSDALRMKAD